MNLEKEEDHHHHHHRENVSENISIGREEKRERDTRASFAIEKGLVRPTTTTTHESSKIARERENFRILRTTKKRGGFRNKMRNGVKTSARTTLLPPPLLPRSGKKVDFRAGFFSTSSSANRFGVGARRALFLSLMMMLFRAAARQQSRALLSFVFQFPFLARFFFLKTPNPK